MGCCASSPSAKDDSEKSYEQMQISPRSGGTPRDPAICAGQPSKDAQRAAPATGSLHRIVSTPDDDGINLRGVQISMPASSESSATIEVSDSVSSFAPPSPRSSPCMLGTVNVDPDVVQTVMAALDQGDHDAAFQLKIILDASPDAVWYQPWKDCSSILHYAAEHCKHEVVLAITDRAAALVHEPDEDGQSPLHIAANHGNLEAARVLCASGRRRGGGCKELVLVDSYKMTPLHLACENGDEAMVAHLLQELNRQERASYVADLRRGSANFLARQGQHQGVVELLESLRASINNVRARTPPPARLPHALRAAAGGLGGAELRWAHASPCAPGDGLAVVAGRRLVALAAPAAAGAGAPI